MWHRNPKVSRSWISNFDLNICVCIGLHIIKCSKCITYVICWIVVKKMLGWTKKGDFNDFCISKHLHVLWLYSSVPVWLHMLFSKIIFGQSFPVCAAGCLCYWCSVVQVWSCPKYHGNAFFLEVQQWFLRRSLWPCLWHLRMCGGHGLDG